MFFSNVAPEFANLIASSEDLIALKTALLLTAEAMGFHFFALTHHPYLTQGSTQGLHLHNYPPEWEARYLAEQLGRADPVRRASHVRASGFRWRDTRSIIPCTTHDDAMFTEAKAFGIGEGFTVPANVPGEVRGSMTFATLEGDRFPDETLFYAQSIGTTAFQTARMIECPRPAQSDTGLTERQLECVMWVGRGKSNWEIGVILGVTEDCVKKHLREACRRYRAVNRASLPLRALYEGSLCFSDIFP